MKSRCGLPRGKYVLHIHDNHYEESNGKYYSYLKFTAIFDCTHERLMHKEVSTKSEMSAADYKDMQIYNKVVGIDVIAKYAVFTFDDTGGVIDYEFPPELHEMLKCAN